MSDRPNILIIWGDDIGISNLSCSSDGLMGYRTPNIDRLADEGIRFTDSYGEQSCTAGRAAFICGQNPYRTGLTKVGMPGADLGLRPEDPTIATALKAQGYATGQFGKNHLGDRDEFLPTLHGFDEFFGNLYHLNAEEEPEHDDYPTAEDFPDFRARFGPRGVLHTWANGDGTQRIEDTGPLTKKRMETCDEEFRDAALDFIGRQQEADTPFFVWFNATHMHFRTHPKPESTGRAGRWQSDYHDTMLDLLEQRVVGTLQIWLDPYVELRAAPKIFNLRTDPYERADITSNTYWDWMIDRIFLAVPAQAYVAGMLQSLVEFPPRQEPSSFSINQVMEKLRATAAAGS